jgi:glycosyltransferase involved in cell wall biosynthesis
MRPFFTVIIPVFNVAPYLRECLDSVLTQKFADWEAICVDDGSTDGSGAVLDEYAVTVHRFRVIHQSNAGVGAARNVALREARGEWIMFLDADDILLDGVLEQLSQFATSDVDIIRFAYCPFEDGAKLVSVSSNATRQSTIVDVSHELKMSELYTYLWQHIFRKKVIDGMRFRSYKRGEDRVFLGDVLLNKVNSVKVVNCVCYGYRQRPCSAMHSEPSPQVLRDEMDHRLDIMEMIDASGKRFGYAGNWWLEIYFTRRMYGIIRSRYADRREVATDWRKRLVRLRRCKGLSRYGRFVAWSCSIVRLDPWDYLACYAIPRYREGGSPIRWVKRKLDSFAK